MAVPSSTNLSKIVSFLFFGALSLLDLMPLQEFSVLVHGSFSKVP